MPINVTSCQRISIQTISLLDLSGNLLLFLILFAVNTQHLLLPERIKTLYLISFIVFGALFEDCLLSNALIRLC